MPPAIFGRSAKPLSGRYLSLAEREELAILHAQGAGVREIARQVGRSASTISRELRRNAATRSGGLDYRATTAQWHAERAARRPKPVKLAVNVALRTYVQDRLAGMVVTPNGTAIAGPSVSWKGRRHGPRQDRRWASAWSPEQIAHRLRLDFPHDEMMRGALRRELTACLRTGRALRVPRARTRGRGKAFIVPEIMISERPAEVGRPGGAWSLGRGPHPGVGQFRDRHAGGAHDAVHDAAALAADGGARRGCQSALERDPGSACKRDPLAAACAGSP